MKSFLRKVNGSGLRKIEKILAHGYRPSRKARVISKRQGASS